MLVSHEKAPYLSCKVDGGNTEASAVCLFLVIVVTQ